MHAALRTINRTPNNNEPLRLSDEQAFLTKVKSGNKLKQQHVDLVRWLHNIQDRSRCSWSQEFILSQLTWCHVLQWEWPPRPELKSLRQTHVWGANRSRQPIVCFYSPLRPHPLVPTGILSAGTGRLCSSDSDSDWITPDDICCIAGNIIFGKNTYWQFAKALAALRYQLQKNS